MEGLPRLAGLGFAPRYSIVTINPLVKINCHKLI